MIGIETWGKNRTSLRGKKSKLQLMQDLGKKLNTNKLDVENLSVKDIKSMLKQEITTKPELPTGRVKAPYVDQLRKIFPNVEKFDKLSLQGLKTLIEALQ